MSRSIQDVVLMQGDEGVIHELGQAQWLTRNELLDALPENSPGGMWRRLARLKRSGFVRAEQVPGMQAVYRLTPAGILLHAAINARSKT
jgi:DNA-binding HxlR family transcriptional regulator